MVWSTQSYYKIANLLIQWIGSLIFICVSYTSFAQSKPNKYGLQITQNAKELLQQTAADSNMQMVALTQLIPQLTLDLKYSTTDNFIKQRLYPRGLQETYLRLPAASALQKVQAALKPMGLALKIWDAYRPYSVTEKMWEPVKDDRYAANPATGSGHNRGIAVDLTLISLHSGKELDMGTSFDHFSDTAHSNFDKLPTEVLKNRKLLKTLMEQHGFKVLDTEWWHFYLPESKKFPLMNLSFRQMKQYYRQIKKKQRP